MCSSLDFNLLAFQFYKILIIFSNLKLWMASAKHNTISKVYKIN